MTTFVGVHQLVELAKAVHASWLNQIEIYFSILQRKALTPNDFTSLKAVKDRLLGFQLHYESMATPFEWKFTKRNLKDLLARIKAKTDGIIESAA